MWKYINIDTIVITIIVLITLYYILKGWTRPRRYKYDTMPKFNVTVQREGASGNSGKRINKHEERCREIFEGLFKQPFPSRRPDFLKNPTTGRNLELDGWCTKSFFKMYPNGIAFEYDGEQHAKYSPYFHKSVKDFEYQVHRDKYKDAVCHQKGILLIRIPHFVAYSDLERYIKVKIKNIANKIR